MGSRLENLLEELKDFHSELDVVHYTNPVGLIGILIDKKIKPNEYYAKTRKSKGVHPEISTLRKSSEKYYTKSRDEMKTLTENSDGVRIHLDTRKITASVRGAKKEPISEFNIVAKNRKNIEFTELKKELENIINKEVNTKELEEFISNLASELNKELGNSIHRKLSDQFEKEYLDKLAKFYKKYGVPPQGNSLKFTNRVLNTIKSFLFSSTSTREGEERIVFNKKTKRDGGIPINPEYMKIEILKEFKPWDLGHITYIYSIDEIEEVIDTIQKNKKLFNVNTNLFVFVTSLVKIIKTAKREM